MCDLLYSTQKFNRKKPSWLLVRNNPAVGRYAPSFESDQRHRGADYSLPCYALFLLGTRRRDSIVSNHRYIQDVTQLFLRLCFGIRLYIQYIDYSLTIDKDPDSYPPRTIVTLPRHPTNSPTRVHTRTCVSIHVRKVNSTQP